MARCSTSTLQRTIIGTGNIEIFAILAALGIWGIGTAFDASSVTKVALNLTYQRSHGKVYAQTEDQIKTRQDYVMML
jgi:hypothetical protein